MWLPLEYLNIKKNYVLEKLRNSDKIVSNTVTCRYVFIRLGTIYLSTIFMYYFNNENFRYFFQKLSRHVKKNENRKVLNVNIRLLFLKKKTK